MDTAEGSFSEGCCSAIIPDSGDRYRRATSKENPRHKHYLPESARPECIVAHTLLCLLLYIFWVGLGQNMNMPLIATARWQNLMDLCYQPRRDKGAENAIAFSTIMAHPTCAFYTHFMILSATAFVVLASQ